MDIMIIKLSFEFMFILFDFYGSRYVPDVVYIINKMLGDRTQRKERNKNNKYSFSLFNKSAKRDIVLPSVSARIEEGVHNSLILHVFLKITDLWFFQWLKKYVPVQPQTKVVLHNRLTEVKTNSFVVGGSRQNTTRSLRIVV